MYRQRAEIPKAEDIYRDALVKKSGKDPMGLEMSRQNLGWCLMMNGEFTESQEVFHKGILETTKRLESGVQGNEPQVLFSTLKSALYHSVGWCTASLTLCESEIAFEDLHADIGKSRGLASRLTAWDPELAFLLRILALQIDLGGRRYRKAKLPKEDTHPLERIWMWALAAARGVESSVEELRSAVVPAKADDFVSVSQLAALHFLYDAVGLDHVKAPRNQVISELRNQRSWRGLPRPHERPWSNREQFRALSIDTKGWPSWGPLEALVRSSSRPNLHVDPNVTEKFIQCLAWCSALLIAFDAQTPTENLLSLLRPDAKDDMVFHTTFGAVLGFAERVGARISPVSGWAEQLAAVLAGTEIWRQAGYDGSQIAARERNSNAHYRNITVDQARRTIDAHQKVIATLAAPLTAVHEIEIQASRTTGPTRIVPAVLVRAQQRLNCGPLMMVDSERPELVYLLQALRVRKKSEGKIEARVALYGDLAGEDLPHQRWIEWG